MHVCMPQTLQFISSKAEVVAGVLKDMPAHPSAPNMEAIEYVMCALSV